MTLTKEDEELIKKAKVLVGKKNVSGGVVKEVGSALRTKEGKIFTGVSLVDKKNRDNTEVIISKNKKVKLKELLPGEWM